MKESSKINTLKLDRYLYLWCIIVLLFTQIQSDMTHYILLNTATDSPEWGQDEYFTPVDLITRNAKLRKEGSDWRWIEYALFENENRFERDEI